MMTTPPRYCEVCLKNGIPTQMEEVREGVWVCPVAREEIRKISGATRAEVREVAQDIDQEVGF